MQIVSPIKNGLKPWWSSDRETPAHRSKAPFCRKGGPPFHPDGRQFPRYRCRDRSPSCLRLLPVREREWWNAPPPHGMPNYWPWWVGQNSTPGLKDNRVCARLWPPRETPEHAGRVNKAPVLRGCRRRWSRWYPGQGRNDTSGWWPWPAPGCWHR